MPYIHVNTLDKGSMPALYVPAANGKHNAPGLVLIQEIFGINSAMQQAATIWSQHGFNVLCPDLFWRQEPGLELNPRNKEQFALGVELMQGMDNNDTLADLEASRRHLEKTLQHSNIAALGYCMGGRLVIQMAQASPIVCAVSYYGVGLDALLPTLEKNVAPSLLHIAELDSYVPVDKRRIIIDEADKREWPHHLYEGCDHAFARPKGEHFIEAAAQLAEQRSAAFLRKHTR